MAHLLKFKTMEEFFKALLSGLIGLVTSDFQHSQNVSDWQMQNQYNQNQYNLHGSPAAKAGELRAAGLSDAAIGQALTGSSGQVTSLVSSPLQPNNITDALRGAFGNLNDTRRVGIERDRLNLDASQIKTNIKLMNKQMDKLTAEYNLDAQQFNFLEALNKRLISLKDYELEEKYAQLQILRYKVQKAHYENDEAKLKSLENQFKIKWFEKIGVPYDNSGFSNPWELAEILLRALGGNIIGKGRFVDYNFNFDEMYNPPTVEDIPIEMKYMQTY